MDVENLYGLPLAKSPGAGGSVPGGRGERLGLYRIGPLLLGESEAMRYCASAIVSAEPFVPECRLLDVAFLRVEVDEQAVALVIAVGPRELVLQAPDKVALDVDALGARLSTFSMCWSTKSMRSIGDDAVCVGLGVLWPRPFSVI